ncbi:MAG: hypothetical protein WCK48_03845 [bacterium]
MGQFWNNNYGWFILVGVVLYFIWKPGILGSIKRLMPSTDGTTTMKDWWKKWWTDGNILPVIVGIICIDISIWMIWPHWWSRVWGENWAYLIPLHLFALLGGSMMAKAKVPFKNKLGKAVVFLALACILNFMDILPVVSEQWWTHREADEISGLTWKTTPPLPLNGTVQEFVIKFWQKNLPIREANAMVKIAELESNFNQWEKGGKDDGKTPYRGRINWKDVGVMQINEDAWLAKSQSLGPDHNIYTLQGNLNFAKWLFHKQGFMPWRSSITRGGGIENLLNFKGVEVPLFPPAPKVFSGPQTHIVIAPSFNENDVWSKPVPMPEGSTHVEFSSKDDVSIRKNNKDVYKAGEGLKLGKDIKVLEFMSETDKPAEVKVIIK